MSASEDFGTVRKPSEPFGNVPNPSEMFRNVPNGSESFRTFPTVSERKATHRITAREAARMFELAGVSRTERSITNWCQPNPQGVARMDAYFDMNERKWFITEESIERAIAEEKAKAAQHSEPFRNPSEARPEPRDNSEPSSRPEARGGEFEERDELHKKLRDSEITNRVKDAYIEQLKHSLASADEERKGYIQQLVEGSRRIGQLESELRQLSAPRNDADGQMPTGA